MHGGEVKERHELVAILLQARDRIWIFGLVGFYEQIKCLVGIIFGFRLPDILQCPPGFRL